MEQVLALEINDDYVTGLLLESGPKTVVVKRYAVAEVGEGLVTALAAVVRDTGFSQGACRVALSTAHVSFRTLSLPFQDRRKIEKVLPFELEELTPFSIDEMQLDALVMGRQGRAEIFAGLVAKEYLATILAALQEAGVDPELVTVAAMPTAAVLAAVPRRDRTFLLLDIGLHHLTMVIVQDGRIALARSVGLDTWGCGGFALSTSETKVVCSRPEEIPTLVDQVVTTLTQTLISAGKSELAAGDQLCYLNGGVGLFATVNEELSRRLDMAVQPCEPAAQMSLKVEPMTDCAWQPGLMNDVLALALWHRREVPLFNFRTGGFALARTFGEWKTKLTIAATAAGLAMAVVTGYLWWDYATLAKERDRLQTEIMATVQQTLPEVARVVDPLQQLKVKLEEGRKLYSGGQAGGRLHKLALLAELSARIPESLPVRITRLVSDQDDLRIMAETRDFNTVDNIKRELEKSPLFASVVISSANLAPRGDGVRFELRLLVR